LRKPANKQTNKVTNLKTQTLRQVRQFSSLAYIVLTCILASYSPFHLSDPWHLPIIESVNPTVV